MGLGKKNRVSIVVGRLIGKVTTNQIANVAGYQLLSPYVLQSKATVSLRQRQKRREAERSGGESMSETDSRRGSHPSSLRRDGGGGGGGWEIEKEKGDGEGEGEGEGTGAGQDTDRREGVRKSQRIVKGELN